MPTEIPPGYLLDDQAGRFMATLGPFFGHWRGDDYLAGFIAEDRHCNPQDEVHGAMLNALADNTLARMAWRAAGNSSCVIVSMNCDYLAAARLGDWVECVGEVTRLTHSLVFIRGRVSVADAPVLTATGVWKRLR